MMMKKIFFSISLLMLFAACDEHDVKVVENSQGRTEYQVLKDENGVEVNDGYYNVYFLSGEQASSGIYVMGKKEGEWKTFAKSGALMEVVTYKNDTLHGRWAQMDEKGRVIMEQFRKNGVLDSLYTLSLEEGVITTQGNYVNGKKDGVWKYACKNDTCIFSITYEEGKIVLPNKK